MNTILVDNIVTNDPWRVEIHKDGNQRSNRVIRLRGMDRLMDGKRRRRRRRRRMLMFVDRLHCSSTPMSVSRMAPPLQRRSNCQGHSWRIVSWHRACVRHTHGVQDDRMDDDPFFGRFHTRHAFLCLSVSVCGIVGWLLLLLLWLFLHCSFSRHKQTTQHTHHTQDTARRTRKRGEERENKPVLRVVKIGNKADPRVENFERISKNRNRIFKIPDSFSMYDIDVMYGNFDASGRDRGQIKGCGTVVVGG